eukprot:m.218589 g.218589  ORF g.218589 m.218589 type:complete len:72 (+) comp39900_c1_seq9:4634-4849(+)
MTDLMDDIVAGQRPVIPQYCPLKYSQLMQACWDAGSNARPAFESVRDSLMQESPSCARNYNQQLRRKPMMM